MSNKLLPEKDVGKTTIKSINPFMKLKHETVKIPHTDKTAGRDTVMHAPDVGAIVINHDKKEPRIILEKQWRHSIKSFIYEIPAGKIDQRDHGDPKHAIERELNEELRIKPGLLAKLTPNPLYFSPGCSNEKIYLYYADKIKHVSKKLPRDLGEYMTLTALTSDQAQEAIGTGKIQDLKTSLAIFYWLAIIKATTVGYGTVK